MNYAIMCEAAEFKETVNNIDDNLLESVSGGINDYEFGALAEASLDTIIDKVKNFFGRIVEFLKGIIEKLKAFFHKMTNNTEKWVNLMEDKVNAAYNRAGSDKFKFEMFDYNESYIISGMRTCISAMTNAWNTDEQLKDLRAGAAEKDIKEAFTMRRTNATSSYTGENNRYNKKDENGNEVKDSSGNAIADGASHDESPQTTKFVEEINQKTEAARAESEKFRDAKKETLAGFFKVSAGGDEKSIWTEVTRKARGDATEKRLREIKPMVSRMLNAIKSNSKTITDIKKVYDDHYAIINRVHTSINNVGQSLNIKNESQIPPKVIAALTTYVSVTYTDVIDRVTFYERATNTAKDLNVNLLKEMTQTYMGALNRFAGVKAAES